jgi:hypothetical protein
MPKRTYDKSKITVIVHEETEDERLVGEVLTRKLEVDVNQLAVNINLFLDQMGGVIANTPDTVGRFQLAEVEISAEITGKGQVVLWGVGGEVGTGGGIKFVFKKGTSPTT